MPCPPVRCPSPVRLKAHHGRISSRGRTTGTVALMRMAKLLASAARSIGQLGFRIRLKRRILWRSWPMTKKQYNTPNVSVGTVKKSIAAMASRQGSAHKSTKAVAIAWTTATNFASIPSAFVTGYPSSRARFSNSCRQPTGRLAPGGNP